MELSIKQLFEESVKKHGDKTAFWVRKDGEEVHSPITYNEAYEDISALGTSLIAMDMKGKGIAVGGGNSYEWAISFVAAICLGVAVPLDMEFGILGFKQYLSLTDCSCAIFSDELHGVIRQVKNDATTQVETLIYIDSEKDEWDTPQHFTLRELLEEGRRLIASGNRGFADIQPERYELCTILLSAAGSGDYKAVELSCGNITAAIVQVSAALKIAAGDKFYSGLPFCIARECICGILLPLCNGAAIVFDEGFDCDYNVSALKAYGLAESASIAAVDAGGGLRVLPGMKVKIDNPDPETGIGEICLAGENIMTGYRKDQEAAAEALKDGWLFTGDMGRLEENGRLYVAGRKDSAIITKSGETVYPEELESRLNAITYIKGCLVWSDGPDNSITATFQTDEEDLELIWGEVRKINRDLQPFKRIENIKLRCNDFLRDSFQKIIRWEIGHRYEF